MLEALLRTKFRLAEGGEVEDLGADGHQGREDPLTAAVFARLSYLPAALASEVLGDAVLGRTGDRWPGLSAHARWSFWPSLPPGPDSPHVRRVEPDVVVVDTDRVLLFEAKHRGSQGGGQWVAQLSAARRKWPDRALVLVAVGGLQAEDDAARVAAVPSHLRGSVFRLPWPRLRRAVARAARGCEDASRQRLLRDIDRALTHWGYREPRSFGSLVKLAAGVRADRLHGWRPTVPRAQGMAGLVACAADVPSRSTSLSPWKPT